MPEYEVKAELPADLDAFTRGYLECAEWCGLQEEDRERFDRASRPRWAAKTLREVKAACALFQETHAAILAKYDASRAGHDFYLTRNRHGAGFWDGPYDVTDQRTLTDAAHAWGETNVSFFRVLRED